MEIKHSYNRREFIRLTGIAGAAALIAPDSALGAAKKRRHPIGATGILWRGGANAMDTTLKDVAALGFHGFETFGNVMEDWEKNRGGFAQLIQKHGVPIISLFCEGDVLDAAKRKQSLDNLVRWSKMLKANGGKVIEFGAGGGRGRNFDYKQYKQNMIESMNEYAKAVVGEGLICAMHTHTGTPVETQEEVEFVLNNVDTRYMKFGPDIGQVLKGGGDPVKLVKDYVSLIEHMHFKDFAGQDQLQNGYLGYCPLGQGKVKLEEILNILEKKKKKMGGMIMFELDATGRAPMPAFEAAKISRDYCASLGYKFEKKTV